MTVEKVNEVLERLRSWRFKNLVDFTHNGEGWEVRVQVPLAEWYVIRFFWLNTSHHLEMRHGGGSDFVWWVDLSITNEIALEFNGNIYDDGLSGKVKPKENWCPTYLDYLKVIYPRALEHSVFLSDAPEAFR